MKFALRLAKFISPFMICGACLGQTPTIDEVVGDSLSTSRPTVRQWNDFQETQEQLVRDNEELKGQIFDLVTGQKRLFNRFDKVDNNFLNLFNIVKETNNIIQGDNASIVSQQEKKWLKIALYLAAGCGVYSVLSSIFVRRNAR